MEGAVVTEISKLTQKPFAVTAAGVEFLALPAGYAAHYPESLIKPGPQVGALVVSTLGAVRDYLQANKDALDLTGLVVHIVSPTEVRVLSPFNDRDRTRETFINAKTIDLSTEFLGKFMPIEDFVLGMQIRFTDKHDRATILRLLSNVKSEDVKTSQDDGISQVVTAKAGIALVSEHPVPNPVTLAPFRAFRDVEQPESQFVLRVKKTQALPEVGLFEADGGAWRLVAIDRVRAWLAGELPAGVAVLG